MYHAHFGLQKALFDAGIAQDTAVFRSGTHEQLVANFKLALRAPSSIITLTGPPGIGKTTLTSTALRAASKQLAIAWLTGHVTNATELLELLLVEFGVNAHRATRVERLQLWRQFHGEMGATECRVFIVVERADDWSIEVLRALDGLTAPDATGFTGANVVLLGQAGLEERLAAPALESLRQRIRLRAELGPYSAAELQDYLRHQTACAGGDYDHVFAPGTVAALHAYSGGALRLANNLCETALTLASEQGRKTLTVEIVGKAAQLLGLVVAIVAPSAVTVSARTAVEKEPAAERPAEPPGRTAPERPIDAAVPAAPPQPAAAQSQRSAPPPATHAATPPAPASATPKSVAPKAPPAAAFPARAPEYDGSATDALAATDAFAATDATATTDAFDVSALNFPLLTDAVEVPPPTPARRKIPPAAAPAPGRTATAPAAVPQRPTAAPAERPRVPAPGRRLETAYTPSKTAPPRAATPTATPTPAAPATAPGMTKPPPQNRSADEEPDDLLRQTQTMRAISVAKSIDDISNSVAETLFSGAELDLLTAALAAAAVDSEPAATPATATPAPAAAAPAPRPSAPPTAPVPKSARARPPDDDLLDLLDLTSGGPLELLDDSRQDAHSRKTVRQS